MPCYNSKEIWFRESIESVLNQSFKDFELIIVNDCSTNDIEKTILEYKEKDDRIVYLKNEKNLKITKTLNHGLSVAK
jgi:glycosyltransferase involved in cell wall biosynthesis